MVKCFFNQFKIVAFLVYRFILLSSEGWKINREISGALLPVVRFATHAYHLTVQNQCQRFGIVRFVVVRITQNPEANSLNQVKLQFLVGNWSKDLKIWLVLTLFLRMLG